MRFRIIIFFVFSILCLMGCHSGKGIDSRLTALRKARKELAARKRVIFNNDGCDAGQLFPAKWKSNPENLVRLRGLGLIGTDVTTISYCTGSTSFSQFLHRTKIGEMQPHVTPYWKKRGRMNMLSELVKRNSDPLKVYVEFAKKNGLEIFWSRRMNDTHDVSRSANNPYFPHWSKFKETHPQYLFGKMSQHFKNGRWSAVDFSYREIRDLTVAYFREVCENYDIDGIELDYFRHLFLFRNVGNGGAASREELDMLTDMMRKIRTMTEEIGMKRGRPILISVRVPDSAEYCEKVGIDLGKWCDEDLIDIVMGSGYFRLNSWSKLVDFGRKHKVTVLAALSEPRIPSPTPNFCRMTNECYRARAMDAWSSGVDGLYIFNEYYPDNCKYLREIGSIASLRFLNKQYFVSYLSGSPEEYLNGGEAFVGKSRVYPGHSLPLPPNVEKSFELDIGDDFQEDKAFKPNISPKCVAYAKIPKLASEKEIAIKVNGHILTQKSLAKPVLKIGIPPEYLVSGKNIFTLTWQPNSSGKRSNWDMSYVCDHKLTYPRQLPWRRLFHFPNGKEEIVDGALLLADMSTGKDQMNNLAYPWSVDPDGVTVVETSMKLEKSDAPRAVCLRFSNGEKVEYLSFQKDGIKLEFAGLSYPMTPAENYHDYRIELLKNDVKVYVDEKLAIDGKNALKTSVESPSARLNFGMGNSTAWNKQSLIFGSCSGPGTGSALWRYIRYRSSLITLDDFSLKVSFEKEKDSADTSRATPDNSLNLASIRKLKFNNVLSYDSPNASENGFLTDPRHWRSTYKKNAIRVVCDDDLKRDVLELNNNGSGSREYPIILMRDKSPSLTNRYLIIDCEMKMLSKTKMPQFQISVGKPLEDGRFLKLSMKFHLNMLEKASHMKTLKMVDLKNSWHRYTLIFDFQKKLAKVYLDDDAKPAISGLMETKVDDDVNPIVFGDGSSSIKGKVRLKFFRYKYSQTLKPRE